MNTAPADSDLQDTTDSALLAAYAGRRDEAAFAELVRRHAGWVEGVALRAHRRCFRKSPQEANAK